MSTHTLTTFRYDAALSNFVKKTTQRALGLNEIKIRVTHSGICYTDVHAKDKACGLGHEGVGLVTDVGDAVKSMKPGDRVGWGWLRSSCGTCDVCVEGYRQYCWQAAGFAFCDHEQGAFADFHIIDADFAYHIPAGIQSHHAGVFMCAGASTYEALDAAGTKPHHRVGVVGLGGLGHMAVLLAKAMGCAVTVFSSSTGSGSQSKAKDAFELGADELRSLSDINTPNFPNRFGDPPRDRSSKALIDVLLICANETPDLEQMLPFLARRATIVLMSIQQKPLVIPYMPFILPGHSIIASTEASRQNHLAMIQFAARHQISPWVERYPMTAHGLKMAFERLEKGEMRFRGVLEVPAAGI
ncbi:GroES-like protein [Aureobasidium pullulans]|uniref:GroES-like protein n=1 Tax=Aureobasidium pullulans TaxID=5580 RepID=A0A4S9D8Z2_AURPU|nr:GroES-like protein [Aureobasidium pullulans]